MKDLGEIEYCLGMKVTRDRAARTLTLSQEAYCESVLARFSMEECNPVKVPADPSVVLTKAMSPTTDAEKQEMKNCPYLAVLGSVMYLMVCTRPDIAFAVHDLAKFGQNPGKAHWNAMRHLLRYLRGTTTLGLVLGGNEKPQLSAYSVPEMVGYTDADYARDPDSRRSVTGYLLSLGRGAFVYKSCKQEATALSTCDAEWFSLSACVKSLLFMRRLLNDIGCTQTGPTVVNEDNQAVLSILADQSPAPRLKHIDVRHHFIRDQSVAELVDVQYCESHNMVADILTKPLARVAFERLRERLLGYLLMATPVEV